MRRSPAALVAPVLALFCCATPAWSQRTAVPVGPEVPAADSGALVTEAEAPRPGGLVEAPANVGAPVPPLRPARLAPSATLQGAQEPIDLAEPGALYPPFGDPLLHDARPLRVRTYVLPGTFEYAEPREFRDYYPSPPGR